MMSTYKVVYSLDGVGQYMMDIQACNADEARAVAINRLSKSKRDFKILAVELDGNVLV